MEFATQILDECIIAANENKKEKDAVNDSNDKRQQHAEISDIRLAAGPAKRHSIKHISPQD